MIVHILPVSLPCKRAALNPQQPYLLPSWSAHPREHFCVRSAHRGRVLHWRYLQLHQSLGRFQQISESAAFGSLGG